MNKYKQCVAQMQLQLNGLLNDLNSRHNPLEIFSKTAKGYKNMLSAKDMILCANRYIWKNLPINFTSQQLESLFYTYGSLCFFKKDDKLVIGRYTSTGELNSEGRLSKIIPLDFSGKSYKTVYNVLNNYTDNITDNSAVIINDYSALYQHEGVVSRGTINNDSTISDQLEVFKQLRINIKLSIKKAIALCKDDDQKNAVMQQVSTILNNDYPIIPLSGGKSEIENLLEMWNFDKNFDTQNYCQQIDYYDKIRRKFNGIPSPDTFEKKERKITAESANDNADTFLTLFDGYQQRKDGLELCKKFLNIPGLEKTDVIINPILYSEETEESEKAEESEESKNEEKGDIENELDSDDDKV